jgi:hypothetical protein
MKFAVFYLAKHHLNRTTKITKSLFSGLKSSSSTVANQPHLQNLAKTLLTELSVSSPQGTRDSVARVGNHGFQKT